MDPREERLARNEVLFREVNEQVLEVAAGHGQDGHRYEFFCECSNRDCTLKLSLAVEAYEAVRAYPDRFAVAPGHGMPEIERVVERCDGYDVVAKDGLAGRLAEVHDPRS
ncbi:MAG: hypothetical protein ACR2GT_00200 [Gaiellaceae bacterium]